jgi:hypothetical protein
MRPLVRIKSFIPTSRKLGAESNGVRAFAPVPVLHALGGAAGAWDELIAFGLIIGFLVGLGYLARRSAKKSRTRWRRRRALVQDETKNRRE